MRDLDHPENPYRDQYEEWDRWTYEHVRGTTNNDISDWYRGDVADGYIMLTIRVDKQGNVVPLRLSTADDIAQRHDPNYAPETDCRFSLRGGGQISRQTLDRLDEMLVGLQMPYAPEIPRWLAAAPPDRVMFMPDGNVITIGEPDPDRRIDHRPNSAGGGDPASVVRLMDPGGGLLAESAPGAPWFTVYFDGFADLTARMNAGGSSYWEYGGYIVFSDPATREIKAIYDYDGTELPVDSGVNWYESRFEIIRGADLPVLYRLQNND